MTARFQPYPISGWPGVLLGEFRAGDAAAAPVAAALQLELRHDLARALRPGVTDAASPGRAPEHELTALVVPRAQALGITVVLEHRRTRRTVWSDRLLLRGHDGPALSAATLRIARGVTLALRTEAGRDHRAPRRAAPMRAWAALWTRPQTQASNAAALAEVAAAGPGAAECARTLAAQAYAHWRAARYAWNGVSAGAGMDHALETATQAVALDPDDADARFVLGMTHLARGEHALAEAFLVSAAELDPSHAPAHGNLGFLRLLQGDLAGADTHCARALAISPAEPLRCVWIGSRSFVHMFEGEVDAARREAAAAVAANPAHRFGWLASAAAAALADRPEEAAAAMVRLRALTEAGTDDPLAAPQLRNATSALWERAEPVLDAARRLAGGGSPRLAPPPRPRIRVVTLGGFGIERDGRALRFGRKPPRKPLELLKALVAFGGQGVAVGRIVAALWPDETGPHLRRRFDTALYRLRRLLGEDAVECAGDLASLANAVVEVDALELLRSSDSQRYAGAFLPQDLDLPWTMPMREALRESHQAALADHAEQAMRAGRYAEALRACERGISVDRASERLYQVALRICTLAGWRGEGAQLYLRCRESLREDLGLSPSAATESAYRALLGGPAT